MSTASPKRILSDLVKLETAVSQFEDELSDDHKAEAYRKVEEAQYIPAMYPPSQDIEAAKALWFELRQRYFDAVDTYARKLAVQYHQTYAGL